MDQKIMLVVLGVAALAFASLAFAAGGQGWSANGTQLDGWNGTAMRHGMMRGGQGVGNATGCGAKPEWAGNGTFAQRFNSTEQKAFEAAVESGDFAAAAKLHEEYGFGGPMFEKLNATTFAKFSQVHKLQSELMADLGMERGPGMMGKEGMGKKQGGCGMGRGMHRQMD